MTDTTQDQGVGAAPEETTAQQDGARSSLGGRLLYSSPELIAAGAAGFALPAMILLLAGKFYIPLVIVLGVVCALGAMALNGLEARTRDDARWGVWTLCAIVAVIGWFLLNAHWSAQDLYATRDPATYNLAGRWLVDHHAMPIPTDPQVFGKPKNGALASAGFGYNGYGLVYAQGNHLLPVLLAVGGWIGGSAVLLKTNVLIGALALYAFFGMARRVVGSFFGLMAMLALAVSMPMLYISRDTYSEAITLLLLAGGLSIAWRAIERGRVRDYALAGVVAGGSSMARIDSYASMLAIIVVAAVVLAAAPAGRRLLAGAQSGALLVGAAIPTYIGYRDVRRLSSLYYVDQLSQISMLRKAAIALAILGVITVIVAWYTPLFRRLFDGDRRKMLAIGAAAATVLGFVVLASRPLWLVRHTTSNTLIAALQKAGGHTVDGTRTYAEQTLSWQAWYFGWATVALAAVGYALLVYRLVRRADLRLLPLLVMTLSLTALYLWTPQIVPDQVWAMRRYVPVVIPGLLVAAAYLLRVVFDERRWQRQVAWARPLALVGAAAMVLVPAAVTWPMERVRADVGQLAQAKAICAAVGNRGAVAELDSGASMSYQQTLRAYCDIPSLGVVGATSSELAGMRAAAAGHGRTLYVLSQDPKSVPFSTAGTPQPFNSLASRRWTQTVEKVPQAISNYHLTFWLGRVNADGSVQPVTPG